MYRPKQINAQHPDETSFGQKLEDISDIHKMYYTAVSQSCNRLGEELREDKKLRRIIEEIEKVILL